MEPRKWTAQALLTLDAEREMTQSVAAKVRPLTEKDWSGLGRVFHCAFGKLPPFAGFEEEASAKLVQDCLKSTREGREGELLTPACLVAESLGKLVGAALLNEVVARLLASDYRHLASTFLVGNTESELWHWRMGFVLLPSSHGASP